MSGGKKELELMRERATSSLRHFDTKTLTSQNEQKAFWINPYNLLVLDAIVHLNNRTRVTEGWFGVLRFFRRAAYMVNGARFSLEVIEHGVLCANKGVHFSLVSILTMKPAEEIMLQNRSIPASNSP